MKIDEYFFFSETAFTPVFVALLQLSLHRVIVLVRTRIVMSLLSSHNIDDRGARIWFLKLIYLLLVMTDTIVTCVGLCRAGEVTVQRFVVGRHSSFVGSILRYSVWFRDSYTHFDWSKAWLIKGLIDNL